MGYRYLSAKPPIRCTDDCVEVLDEPYEQLPWPRSTASVT